MDHGKLITTILWATIVLVAYEALKGVSGPQLTNNGSQPIDLALPGSGSTLTELANDDANGLSAGATALADQESVFFSF